MTQTLVLPSPNEIDGTPYEVVQQCLESASGAALVARNYLREADTMIQNSTLQRALDSGDPGPTDLKRLAESHQERTHPLAKTADSIIASLEESIRRLQALASASGYDPKHPPKE